MRHIFAIILLNILSSLPLWAKTPRCDFSFTTREGEATTLHETTGRLHPDAHVWLLLFDPDCGECHELELRLAADPEVASSLADRSGAVIAIYPTDGVPTSDDPNLASYMRVCRELPGEWTVGIDNGSIFETDACVWDNLPLLLEFKAGEFTPSPSTE